MQSENLDLFCPTSRQDWRNWLKENHQSKQSVWLVYYKKSSGVSTITWSEAVDEALCFGWIDSTRKTLDNEKFMQFFSKRKPNSGWSKINKQKVQLLIDAGLMAQAGYNCIETAKQNGSWGILDIVEELQIPKDLENHFEASQDAEAYFLSLSKSTRKSILQWLMLAKRPETRQKRINEIVELARKKQKPKQFR